MKLKPSALQPCCLDLRFLFAQNCLVPTQVLFWIYFYVKILWRFDISFGSNNARRFIFSFAPHFCSFEDLQKIELKKKKRKTHVSHNSVLLASSCIPTAPHKLCHYVCLSLRQGRLTLRKSKVNLKHHSMNSLKVIYISKHWR